MNIQLNRVFWHLFLILCFLHLSGRSAYAQDRDPLWTAQNEFIKDGYGLKGPVYSVVTKSKFPVVELGKVVRTGNSKRDSLVFDEAGYIAKKYDFGNKLIVTTFTHFPDSIEYSVDDQYHKPQSSALSYKRDASGRIIEVNYYKEGKLNARRIFEYTPTGFESRYYEGTKKVAFARKGNEFAEVGGSGLDRTGKLDKEGRVISQTEAVPFVAKFTTQYAYNQNGDLIRKGDKSKLGNSIVGTLRSNESGSRYEYVYDQYGNWIEKRTYINGELQKGYEVREIVYKSPEEIIAEKKAEAERNRLFEEELQRKGEEYADRFVEDQCIPPFKECLTYMADNFIGNSIPIKSFSVTNDKYSFEFSDGTKVDNIEFESIERWHSYNGCDNLISSDMHIVLVPQYQYTHQGPKWYVVKYGKIADFDFNPSDSIDWVKLYRDKFYSRNNIEEEEIQALWKNNLYKLWRNSRCSSIEKQVYYLNPNEVCVNELTNAYENGFVSPKGANKVSETESLERYNKFKEDEKRKKLCAIAYSACVFNDKNKPEADKLKKFNCDESGYYFKKKDNNEIVNPKFDTELYGRDVQVYLSSDQSVALVYKRLYADYYLFLVELDGDNVKSVNYGAPKDVIKFYPPTDIEHRYNTGYS